MDVLNLNQKKKERKRKKKKSDHCRKDATVIYVYTNKRLVFKGISKIFTEA